MKASSVKILRDITVIGEADFGFRHTLLAKILFGSPHVDLDFFDFKEGETLYGFSYTLRGKNYFRSYGGEFHISEFSMFGRKNIEIQPDKDWQFHPERYRVIRKPNNPQIQNK